MPIPSAQRRSAILFLIRQISRLPRGFADRAFGAAGIAVALAEPRRVALAYTWAAAQDPRIVQRWHILPSVLAHRGRAFMDSWAPVFEKPAELRSRVRLEGRQHLDAVVGRPSILLSFHLGLPLIGWALSAHGYDTVVAGGEDWGFEGRARAQPGWSWNEESQRVPFASREDGDRGRAVALHRLRALLSAGRPIRMVGDGEIGRELFRVPAPIGALVIRSGWWSLRRHVGATVVPVMSYREGSGAVVTAYPPLSEPVPDAQDDLDRCRTELVPLIQDFVIHHPDQCLPWIFDLA